MSNKDFITSIADRLNYSLDICPENCKYHTPDGGCRKSYIPCPSYIEEDDTCDLGCGGVSFEFDEENIDNEINEK